MSNDDLEHYEKMSKVAGKASSVFVTIMIIGCLIPIIFICLGTLFSK